jgi:Mg2+ and Co2+ transporter CorA
MVKAIYIEEYVRKLEVADAFHFDPKKKYLWLDFIDPLDQDVELLHKHYGITTPLVDELDEVDLYNIKKYPNYYVFHLSYITQGIDADYELKNAACLLCVNRTLITLRSVQLDSFDTVRERILSGEESFTDGYLFSALLFAERIDFDTLEMKRMIVRISDLTNRIGFKRELSAARLDEINKHINYMLLIRLVMMNQQLTLNSIQKLDLLKDETKVLISEMQQDIRYAIDYADFNTHRLDFMMNSFVAYLNIQQNSYIHMFTFITILLSPAILVAGFYGMNVQGLPGAERHNGVWVALSIMAFGTLISYLFIRFVKPKAF